MTEQVNGGSAAQNIIFVLELMVFASFAVSALFFSAPPGKGVALWKARLRGSVSFGFVPPLLVILLADSLGGPLLLPIFAVFGAMLGFVFGTAYFFIVCRGK